YDAGQIFHPKFLAAIAASGATVLRFMDPLSTNNQVRQYWEDLNGSAFVNDFTVNPQNGDMGAPRVSAWPGFSGTYLITLQNGQSLQATLANGLTTVAFGVPVSGNCTAPTCHIHAINGWANRPPPGQVSYTTLQGAPLETVLQMSNAAARDAWV